MKRFKYRQIKKYKYKVREKKEGDTKIMIYIGSDIQRQIYTKTEIYIDRDIQRKRYTKADIYIDRDIHRQRYT